MAKRSLNNLKNTATAKVDVGELLSETKVPEEGFAIWLVGDTPLISHAWSEKARREMLKGQSGATQSAKEKRNPEQDFLNSLYEVEKGVYGFPVTGVKRAILSCAHKDRGVPRSDVMQALWLDAEEVRTKTAHPGAHCNMPLVRIYGAPPEMREDMVRIGAGMRKTANLAYRAQFTTWALRITGAVDPRVVPVHALVFLMRQAGRGIGIGDWRNEKGGWFGGFHLADTVEREAWEAFADGKGPLPGKKKAKARPRRPLTDETVTGPGLALN